ncbi:MAG: hypothetical protein ACYC35_11140 [Pirellulales bacterium]
MKNVRLGWATLALVAGVVGSAGAAVFNGAGDNQRDDLGYYYIVTGGKFPTGTTPNGDNASGGTFRFLTDDPAWGYPVDTWKKDDWFADNAGFALTLKNSGAAVYDNNGLEDGSYGDYYNASGSHGTHGLYRGYSMSNNWDWIYAGYFKLTEATTFDTIIGYFDANGGAADVYPFQPFSAAIQYRMNIWSNVASDLLPTNTGSFAGDVFTTDSVPGTFTVTDTGVVRVMPDGSTDPIYRLTFAPSAPITLQPGEYWFSHDASVVPEPSTFVVWSLLGLIAGGFGIWRRKK